MTQFSIPTFDQGVRLSQGPIQPQGWRKKSEVGHGVPQVPGHGHLSAMSVSYRPFNLEQQVLIPLSVGAM